MFSPHVAGSESVAARPMPRNLLRPVPFPSPQAIVSKVKQKTLQEEVDFLRARLDEEAAKNHSGTPPRLQYYTACKGVRYHGGGGGTGG